MQCPNQARSPNQIGGVRIKSKVRIKAKVRIKLEVRIKLLVSESGWESESNGSCPNQGLHPNQDSLIRIKFRVRINSVSAQHSAFWVAQSTSSRTPQQASRYTCCFDDSKATSGPLDVSTSFVVPS